MPQKNERTSRPTKLKLVVVTPTRIELEQEVDYVVAPTVKGMIGILPGHIRLMTVLDTGVLRYRVNGESFYMAVSEGYMEVTPEKVVILAEFMP